MASLLLIGCGDPAPVEDQVATPAVAPMVSFGGWKIASDGNGEFIDIDNDGSAAVSLDGWSLVEDYGGDRYDFGDVVLDPGATLRVRSGCGTDSSVGATVYWCADDPDVWEDDAGHAKLFDAEGALIVEESYRASHDE